MNEREAIGIFTSSGSNKHCSDLRVEAPKHDMRVHRKRQHRRLMH